MTDKPKTLEEMTPEQLRDAIAGFTLEQLKLGLVGILLKRKLGADV